MALDDPYGAGIWGQWAQGVQESPLMPGKIAAQQAAIDDTRAQTQGRRIANDEAQQMSPLRVAAAQLGLHDAQTDSRIKEIGANQTEVADIISHYDWSDPDQAKAGNAALEHARDAGNTVAAPLVGRVSTQNADRLTAVYGAKTPQEARAAQTETGAGTAGDSVAGRYGMPKPSDITPQQWAAIPDQDLQKGIQANTALLGGLENIRKMTDPVKALQAVEAYAYAHNRWDLVTDFQRDPAGTLSRAEAEIRSPLSLAQQEAQRRATGLPAPLDNVQVIKGPQGEVTSITMPNQAGQAPTAKQIAAPVAPVPSEPYIALYGPGPNGGAQVLNKVTGIVTEQQGTSAARPTRTQELEELGKQAGLSGKDLADYVNGEKPMDTTHIAAGKAAAISAYIRSQAAMGQPEDPATIAQISAYWDSIGKPAQDGAPAAPALTAPQAAAVQKFKGSTAKAGTMQNPYAPKSEAEYNHLGKGQYYVATDGTIRQKN